EASGSTFATSGQRRHSRTQLHLTGGFACSFLRFAARFAGYARLCFYFDFLCGGLLQHGQAGPLVFHDLEAFRQSIQVSFAHVARKEVDGLLTAAPQCNGTLVEEVSLTTLVRFYAVSQFVSSPCSVSVTLRAGWGIRFASPTYIPLSDSQVTSLFL